MCQLADAQVQSSPKKTWLFVVHILCEKMLTNEFRLILKLHSPCTMLGLSTLVCTSARTSVTDQRRSIRSQLIRIQDACSYRLWPTHLCLRTDFVFKIKHIFGILTTKKLFFPYPFFFNFRGDLNVAWAMTLTLCRRLCLFFGLLVLRAPFVGTNKLFLG